MSRYHAGPAVCSSAPGKRFNRRREAMAYARTAADLLGLPYAVWRVRPGRLRLLCRFQPRLVPERDPRA